VVCAVHAGLNDLNRLLRTSTHTDLPLPPLLLHIRPETCNHLIDLGFPLHLDYAPNMGSSHQRPALGCESVAFADKNAGGERAGMSKGIIVCWGIGGWLGGRRRR